MRTGYQRASGLCDALGRVAELSARTVIFDMEPLVARWNGPHESLDEGIARVLSETATLPTVKPRNTNAFPGQGW